MFLAERSEYIEVGPVWQVREFERSSSVSPLLPQNNDSASIPLKKLTETQEAVVILYC